ncbi:hypothetical protein ACFQZE_24050 [Paenibacillus sp. GCM10027627]
MSPALEVGSDADRDAIARRDSSGAEWASPSTDDVDVVLFMKRLKDVIR